MKLQNAGVLVTGGSSGIGYGIAQALVDAGARVAITGRNEALKTQLANDCGQDPNDRDAYRLGKATFIRTITDRALAEGLPRLN